jgi:hypothetical protein
VIVDQLCHAVDEVRDVFALAGVAIELRRSADGPKAGAWLEATSARGLAQVVLWESGELDLTISDSKTGDVVLNEHRQVSTRLGVDDALRTIRDYLGEV